MRLLAKACAVFTLLLCAAAQASEAPSRVEYTHSAEAICKPGSQATEAAVRGVHSEIRAERLALAAAKFAHAERIFAHTVAALEPLPRPPADFSTLATWFRYLGREKLYLGKIAAALRAGQTIASQHYMARFVHEGNLANDVVIDFDFNYCAFKLQRYV